MALAIGSCLDPVAAQRGHAPPPRRRLEAIEEHTAAFLGRSPLQVIVAATSSAAPRDN
jgi:hypothetical protein